MGSLPGLQTAFLSMSSPGLSSVHGPEREGAGGERGGEREQEGERGRGRGTEEREGEGDRLTGEVCSMVSLLTRILILLNQGSSLTTSSNLDSLASHLQAQPDLHWGQGFNVQI